MKKERIMNVISKFGKDNKATEIIEKTEHQIVERIFHEVYELLRSQNIHGNVLTSLTIVPMTADAIGTAAFHQAMIADDIDYFDGKHCFVPVQDEENANIYLIAALSMFVNTEEFTTSPSTIVITVEVNSELLLMFREKFQDTILVYVIPEKPGVPIDYDLLKRCGYYYLYPETITMRSRKKDEELLNQDPKSKDYVEPNLTEIGLRSLIRPEEDNEFMDEDEWEKWVNSPEPGAGYEFKIGAGYALWMLSRKVQLFDYELGYANENGLLKLIRMASNIYQDKLSIYPFAEYLVGGELDLKDGWDLVKDSPEDMVKLLKEVADEVNLSMQMTTWGFPAIAETIKERTIRELTIEDLSM